MFGHEGELVATVGGGIVVDPFTNLVTSEQVLWTFYVLGIFFLVKIVFLNVIFAIIVDEFVAIRERRAVAQEKMESQCFVCSIPREEFLSNAKDFTTHLRSEHNYIHYLYFFAYLREKLKRLAAKNGQVDEHRFFTDIESEIIEKIRCKEGVGCFPNRRAIVFELEQESTATDKFSDFLKKLSKQINSSLISQRDIVNLASQIDEQLAAAKYMFEKPSTRHKGKNPS